MVVGKSRMREKASFYLNLIMRIRRKNLVCVEESKELKTNNTFVDLLEMSITKQHEITTLNEFVTSELSILENIYEKARKKFVLKAIENFSVEKFLCKKNAKPKNLATIFTDMKELDKIYLDNGHTENRQSVIVKSETDKKLSKKRKILHDVSSLSEKNCYRILKRNPLSVRIGKSSIHSYGLFIEEDVPPNTMIIEYVGEKIRVMLADMREKYNSKLNSSYFFRVDSKYVIDASYTGNYARFINHSCDPNCYAKVIKFENDLKIVIYSLVAIKKGDELTYNYNFPLEHEKIKCLCNSDKCKGYLN